MLKILRVSFTSYYCMFDLIVFAILLFYPKLHSFPTRRSSDLFPICQQITMSNLFSAAFSIFGDLLMPPRFACNLT